MWLPRSLLDRIYRRSAALPARAYLLAFAVVGLNYLAWSLIHPPVNAPQLESRIAGLTYSPFQRHQDPAKGIFPGDAEIAADLAKMATLTSHLRTYSSAQFPALQRHAGSLGLQVTAGAWITGAADEDVKELRAALFSLQGHDHIKRLIIGNETILKAKVSLDQLARYLQHARANSRVPVSTAEPWNIWLANPSLAQHVDFITIHLLPYWEGIAIENAVGHALYQYNTIQKAFPGKPVVIGEVGWPSNGDTIGNAKASPANQARFIREFMAAVNARPADMRPDYFVMEAVDQPWKVREEGMAGGYWGVADAFRQAKFSFSGLIERDPYWQYKALFSSLAGLIFLCIFLPQLPGFGWLAGMSFALSSQAILSGAVALLTQPMMAYLSIADWLSLLIFLPTLVIMVAILLAHGFEFSELFWKGSLRRQFAFQSPPSPTLSTLSTSSTSPSSPASPEPRVSIHLACCNESPDMVIAAIASLAQLDYGNYEVIVVDNNTQSENLWQPVEAYVASLPEHFKFFHLPAWPGFKAGALNFALSQTDPDATLIAVVDADYIVRKDWLTGLTGFFADPKVGVVQAPQSHRDWHGHAFRRMMNWEYEGFFRIGMHHRNERDAIIQHGTMTLINAAALKAHGAWSEWCVCEDTELGLRLLRNGWTTVYVDEALGHGLTPDSFAAYKKQRHRWAQGGMQIFKAHAHALLTGSRSTNAADHALSRGQRYHFLAGWLPWIGDALHLIFALAALGWTAGIVLAPQLISLPTMWFMLPLGVFICTKLIIGPLLYLRRVPCTLRDVFGAALAGMGVSHAIARGVLAGLLKTRHQFEITSKGDTNRAPESWADIREELCLLVSLLSAVLVFLQFGPTHPHGVQAYSRLWVVMLLLQCLPYLAAVCCAYLSRKPSSRHLSELGRVS